MALEPKITKESTVRQGLAKSSVHFTCKLPMARILYWFFTSVLYNFFNVFSYETGLIVCESARFFLQYSLKNSKKKLVI